MLKMLLNEKIHRMLLNENWDFSYRDVNLKGQKVPFSMYTVLLDNGLMEDPFYRDNEYKATEMSRYDCEAETTFTVSEDFASLKVQKLALHSIDTVADIYLNNQLLGRADDMHHKWEYDVKGKLKCGENTLKIHFYSPIVYREQTDHIFQEAGVAVLVNQQARIRKTASMTGWDWGPNLPDMGIYKDVELIGYNVGKLTDIYVRQHHENGTVRLDIAAEADLHDDCDITIEVTSPDGTVYNAKAENMKAEILIENPQLWWPNGYGSQPLYHVKADLVYEGEVIDSHKLRIGLRTVALSTEEDQWGKEFCFVVNGVKIFAMGSNYVPEDSLLPRRSREKSEKLIKSCVLANFNMIRIWGGGYYAEDYFLDLCDEYGLLIWQDHLFACTGYLVTPDFRENIIMEFTENIKRMRNHPCLALFCGNNEIEMVYNHYGHLGNERLKHDYIEVFETILPKVSEEYAPDIPYWPSSPSSGGNFDKTTDFNYGDSHNWDVWHGGRPFTEYRRHYIRFCSEFGFESFPAMKTIKTFCAPEDMNPFSKVMEDHQKCNDGNGKILNYLSQTYLYPTSFENLVYASQLIQADAIRYGVEHFRRFRGRCMGGLIWQLNDCWPVCSWSSIDYYGRWKGLHYAARRFYAPVLLSAHEKGYEVVLNVSNETMDSFNGRVSFGVYDNYNNKVYSDSVDVSVDKLSSKDIITLDLSEYVKGHDYDYYFAYSLEDNEGNKITTSSLLFVKPKHFNFKNPEIEVAVRDEAGKLVLDFTSKAYARGVYVDFEGFDAILSDNFFDITKGETVTIAVESCDEELTKEKILSNIQITSIWNMDK